MATARSNIPYGSILASLRQRQQDEYQAAEEKKRKKAAFTNQLVQLGGMAAGAALAIPTGGLSLAPMMMGASIGGLGGGLLGNAMTGTPVSMNQGMNAAMQVGSLAARNQQLDINQQIADGKTALNPTAGFSTQIFQRPGVLSPAASINQNFALQAGQMAFNTDQMIGLEYSGLGPSLVNDHQQSIVNPVVAGTKTTKTWDEYIDGQQYAIKQNPDKSKKITSTVNGVTIVKDVPPPSGNIIYDQNVKYMVKPDEKNNPSWYKYVPDNFLGGMQF